MARKKVKKPKVAIKKKEFHQILDKASQPVVKK